MLLDDAMPHWDKREVHRIAADAPPESLFRAFDELTWGEVGVFKALMTVRGLARGRAGDARIYDWFLSSGFVELGRTDDELLVVAAQSSRFRGAPAAVPDRVDTYRTLGAPRTIKIAFNFRVADGYLTTETRVRGTDGQARRVFAAYWLGIRVFSGLIRCVWLRAIRSRAQKLSATG